MTTEEKEKILVVEDELELLQGVKKILTKQGYQVETASDGIRAAEILKEHRFAVSILDLKLPGMDGFEVLKKVKDTNPDTEVIIMTGYGDVDSAIKALKLEASDFITKPFKTESLLIALKRAFEKISIRRQLNEYTTNLEHRVMIATQEILRRKEFESKLVQSSIDAIVASDGNGKIVFFNQAAETIFGYAQSEVLEKKNIKDIYPAHIAEEVTQNLAGGKSPEKPMGWKETHIENQNGETIPVSFSGNIIVEKGEVVGSVGFFHDLRELKKLERELIQSERLAAIGQTVAGLAHYMKNLLNGLEGGIFVANEAFEQNDIPNFKTGWEMLQRNVSRISGLVYDLLSYSKDREPSYEEVAPNEIAEEVFRLMEPTAKEYDIQLTLDLDRSLPRVPLDPKAIHNALLNLVSNAIEACLETEGNSLEVKITTARRDGLLTFEVSDNGIGMDDEVKRKIFTSFFSTKGGRGTGIGLLATRKIIQEHRGEIRVTSRKGRGSTFTILLPITNGESVLRRKEE